MDDTAQNSPTVNTTDTPKTYTPSDIQNMPPVSEPVTTEPVVPQQPVTPPQPEPIPASIPDYSNLDQNPTVPDYSTTTQSNIEQQFPQQEQTYEPIPAPLPAAPPPVIPPAVVANQNSSPKGFIIGGLLALIIVGLIFGAMYLMNKNNEEVAETPEPVVQKTSAPTTTPEITPIPTITATNSPTPMPTLKTTKTYTNSDYKYQFEYPTSLENPTQITIDQARFPKALEVVKLASAYFIVWPTVNDVPKYITSGQNQFIKVNLYTTNRFTIKKTNTQESHYMTQKFNKTYDLMLETPLDQMSDPTFEKILDSFTFIENEASASVQPTSSASASPKL